MERRRIPLTLTLDPATIEEAREAAAEDGRSLSVWIDRAVSAALAPRHHIMTGFLFAPYPGDNKRILCGADSGESNFSDEVDNTENYCPACLLIACRLWLAKDRAEREAAREEARKAPR